jgi:hypothetical protein
VYIYYTLLDGAFILRFLKTGDHYTLLQQHVFCFTYVVPGKTVKVCILPGTFRPETPNSKYIRAPSTPSYFGYLSANMHVLNLLSYGT